MPRCFVISPIGQEGSPEREHADDVFDYIIKPAMDQCGVEVVRADHLQQPGRISDQMFAEIFNDDLCVAVLTGHNPNVFYELAVAQCAARPTIILLQKGEELPFDIRDLRCVYYDLKPRALFEQTYVKEIVGHVESLKKCGWKATVPYGDLLPFGGGGQTGIRVLSKCVEYGDRRAWQELLQQTEHRFDIMGVSLRAWLRSALFEDLLREKTAAGCQARVLLTHPENPVLSLLSRSGQGPSGAGRSRRCEEAYSYLAALAEGSENLQVRQIREGFANVELALTDKKAVVIQYLHSLEAADSPLLECAADSPLYQVYAREFERLWQANPPA